MYAFLMLTLLVLVFWRSGGGNEDAGKMPEEKSSMCAANMSQVKGSATIPNGRLTVVSHSRLAHANKVFLGGDLFVGTGDVWCALISFFFFFGRTSGTS